MDEEHETFTFDIGGAAGGLAAGDPWEAIPSPASPAEENGRGWEMVPVGPAISSYGDDALYVFPPSLHEGLHLQQQNEPHPSPTSIPRDQAPAAAEKSPPRRSPDEEEERKALERGRQLLDSAWSLIGTGLEFVYSKIPSRQGGGSGYCCCCCCTRMTVWSFATLAGMVGAMLYMRRQHRRKKTLLILLQEKDQKISQLLHQIAQMNQIIAGRHRVAVFRRI